MSLSLKIISIGILLFYGLIRWGLNSYWILISPYWGYAFEFAFVLSAFYLLRVKSLGRLTRRDVAPLNVAFVSGFIVHVFAKQQGIQVPFDMSGAETAFLLLILAPLLEELVFRGALQTALVNLLPVKGGVVVLSGALFALSHGIAITYVPEPYYDFVYYQTFYTFALGMFCARAKETSGGLLSAINVHFGFNLGFYIASVFGFNYL